ncbi:MAG: hypothetical protein GY938_20410, partial [Ketobacter sp.]|nr:hypothetical protein [Ketobacter sp.]
MAQLIANPWIQAIDANGDPYSGAKLQIEDEGTSDDRTTYSDAVLSTPNANPLIADSAGLFGPIFIASSDTGLKFTLSESDDTLIDTIDNIPIAGGE